MEPEELERAPAPRACGLPGPAASGQVPHQLVDSPAHAVVAWRSFGFEFFSVPSTRRRRRSFGEDAVQEGHGVAELPVHVLGRELPHPPLLSLSRRDGRKLMRPTRSCQSMWGELWSIWNLVFRWSLARAWTVRLYQGMRPNSCVKLTN